MWYEGLEGAAMAIPILIVDDESSFLDLMANVLGKRGFDVNFARDEAQALHLIGKERFDFALIDLKLGAADGIRVLERIKLDQPRVRAIMVTAYPTEATRAEAAAKGASAYLAKPLEIYKLLETLASSLSH